MTLGPNVVKRDSFGSEAGMLPVEVVRDLYKDVAHESLALKLAGTMPVNINGASATWAIGRPVAGVVGEGERKPLIKGGMARKTITPIKIAAIAVETKEARLANPGSYFDNLYEMLRGSITRAIDLAVFHGKNGLSNSVIPGVEYIDQTENTVRLGTAKAADGGLRTDLLAGWEKVVAARGGFTGFAADDRLIARTMGAVGPGGALLFAHNGEVDLKDKQGTLLGLPVAYNLESVSGEVGAVPDTTVRAYGGDFADNIRLGFVEQINYRRTDQATIVDGDKTMHLWQDNLEAYLIECIFGWIIKDVNHFVKYTEAPAAFATGTSYAKDALVTHGGKEYVAVKDVTEASKTPDADTTNWKTV